MRRSPRMRRGAIMRRAALALIAILRLLLMAARRPLVRPRPVRTARSQSLDGHATPDGVSCAQPLQDAAIARRFARRDLKGHGAHAAARLARQSEGAGALGHRFTTLPRPPIVSHCNRKAACRASLW